MGTKNVLIIDGNCGRRLASGRRRRSRKQRTKSRPSLNLKDHCENRWWSL